MKRGTKKGRAVYEPEAFLFITRLCYLKTRGRCFYCKRPLTQIIEPWNWVKDHFVPRVGGGIDDHSNLVPACKLCDLYKGGKTPPQTVRGLIMFALNLARLGEGVSANLPLKTRKVKPFIPLSPLIGPELRANRPINIPKKIRKAHSALRQLCRIEHDIKLLREMGKELDQDVSLGRRRLILPAATPLKFIRHPVVYSEMLPGCIGFISTNGDCIHYGMHYRSVMGER